MMCNSAVHLTEPNSIPGQQIRETNRSNGIRPAGTAGRGVVPCWRTLWAICNIVSGNADQTAAMVALDAVHVITETLKESNDEDVLEQGDRSREGFFGGKKCIYIYIYIYLARTESSYRESWQIMTNS